MNTLGLFWGARYDLRPARIIQTSFKCLNSDSPPFSFSHILNAIPERRFNPFPWHKITLLIYLMFSHSSLPIDGLSDFFTGKQILFLWSITHLHVLYTTFSISY